MEYKEVTARLRKYTAFADIDRHEIETLQEASDAIEALEAEVGRLLVSESSLAEINREMHNKVTEQRKQLAAAKQAQPERPINCGTGYCSCIECPYEQAQPERAPQEKPIAYFDFQERGFYWAPNTVIGSVPVARKVEPMPLYSNQQAQPERRPLSDDEIFKAFDADIAMVEDAKADAESWETIVNMVRAIEAAHGIKQGGQHD